MPEQLVASNLTLRQFLDTLGISVEQFNYFHREMQEDILSNLVIESVNQRERAAGQATEPIVIEDDMGVERERTN